MASRFQAAALVAAPFYPNAIAWSDENLIAVASGHLVTILNPASPFGPRGLITVPDFEPYAIGVVPRDDLLSGCLLSTCLNRDRHPCVRSVSWSPIGMAPNGGCLLAICTAEGRVKLYRAPFCDFGAEWIEVMDISDRLYGCLASINFWDLDISSTELSNEETEHVSFDDTPNSIPRKEHKRRRVNVSGVINNCSRNKEDADVDFTPSIKEARDFLFKSKENKSLQIVSKSNNKQKTIKKIPDNCTLPLVTTNQYAARNAMLHSLAISWSPVLRLSSKNCPAAQNGSPILFSVLAVGGKSGKVSFWRICVPECYSVEHNTTPTTAVLIGFLQAHDSWITTMSWALLSSDSLNPQVVLVTGSSDGSVKIWVGYGEELLKSAENYHAPFCLLKEVVHVNTVQISVLSLIVPVQSPHKMLLAVGKGSGSFEVWIYDISCSKLDKAGSYDAHDQVVTGLAWSFDGCCLYSCSEDNFVRSWTLHGSSLSEVPIPPNTLGLKISTDLPDAFLSCLGVAVSPGNLVLAMVRNFDTEILDHMYQGRLLKAAVEFFWIGGQKVDASSSTFLEQGFEDYPYFSSMELATWESNVLWSLKQYEHLDKPLVVWDVIAAILAFKRSVPEYVECTLIKWLSTLYLESHVGLSSENILSRVSKNVSKLSSRQLHLLNSICRCVMLSELKTDDINTTVQNLGGLCGTEEEPLSLWMELLLNSERELRERLVGFSFSAFISLTSHSVSRFSQPGYWYPVGIAQMKQWVAQNHEHVKDQLKVLASEVVRHKRRIPSNKDVEEEQCSYCSASVPFDSPEVASCQGSECTNGVREGHKLVRCAVSMQVCPTSPLWFCKCCHRWTSKLAPESLFVMPRSPVDFKHVTESSLQEEFSKPMCPFCGVLLQRLQPDFLLSASPV